MKDSINRQGFNLDALRETLAGKGGQEYWRSLDELANTEEFQELLHREFPEGASEWNDPVGRRQFLKVMGASLAFAGAVSCTIQPVEKLVPYVRQPEELVPGKPLYFASAVSLGGFGRGVLVESHMGRPTKVEGNKEHPDSLGATDVFGQASVLSLYDPDRSQTLRRMGRIETWSNFVGAMNLALAEQRVKNGAGLRLLTETVTSPTLAKQIRDLLAQYPGAKWHQYDPAGHNNAREGARLAFGEAVQTRYDLSRAKVILSLDADFMVNEPGGLRYAREFAAGRRVSGPDAEMNRLYAVESTPSNTGAMADHRLALPAGKIEGFAREVAEGLGLEAGVGDAAGYDEWLGAMVRDLAQRRGECLVLAGQAQPPAVHALAHAMNHALENVGKTVFYTDPVEAEPVDQAASLRELTEDMAAGRVDLLVVLGGNPLYTAPADLEFETHFQKVGLRVHLGAHEDETSRLCHWHLPEAHALEAWSDIRAYDGTVTIVQPLIEPLYSGKSAHELLAVLAGTPGRPGYELVREYWRAQYGKDDFERFWRQSLHDGVVAGTALAPRQVSLRQNLEIGSGAVAVVEGLEVVFRADPTVWDGRFSNNGWLQELPKPMTRLTWDNAALLAPSTAQRLGLSNEDVVELAYRGRTVKAPVWILPGQPEDSVTVHLGYGRSQAGRVGTGAGFNAYAIRTLDAPWFGTGLEIRKTDERYELACTQDHSSLEGRPLLRVGDIEEFRRNEDFVHEMGENPTEEMTLYNPDQHLHGGYAWGMAIDLNACIGCNACSVACQSENNISVVGKDQVLKAREMHWIRIDRYFKGDLDSPETYYQPVPCMQCENAPCEVVCPVAATVHSDEGLNDMVYNRCVGTRYCSNNCPYKVRRFNFLHYADVETPSLKLLRNPDVTVRARGVMEKCTYCVQRINHARIDAKKEDRKIRDGEVVTACQQVCPTQAIVFGDLNDPNSEVSKRKAEKLNYSMLADLNTRPRTTYLARLRNPNPEIQHG